MYVIKSGSKVDIDFFYIFALDVPIERSSIFCIFYKSIYRNFLRIRTAELNIQFFLLKQIF